MKNVFAWFCTCCELGTGVQSHNSCASQFKLGIQIKLWFFEDWSLAPPDPPEHHMPAQIKGRCHGGASQSHSWCSLPGDSEASLQEGAIRFHLPLRPEPMLLIWAERLGRGYGISCQFFGHSPFPLYWFLLVVSTFGEMRQNKQIHQPSARFAYLLACF